jgi:hypothetical protein
MKSSLRVHGPLSKLAKTVFGSQAVVRAGVGDFYEDKEPQRKFLVEVEVSGVLRMEMVAPPHRSRRKRASVVRAAKAALVAISSGGSLDWLGWHDGHSWSGQPAKIAGDSKAAIYRSSNVGFLSMRKGVHARFWDIERAEHAALAMVLSLVPPGWVARQAQLFERKTRCPPVFDGHFSFDGLFQRDVQ